MKKIVLFGLLLALALGTTSATAATVKSSIQSDLALSEFVVIDDKADFDKATVTWPGRIYPTNPRDPNSVRPPFKVIPETRPTPDGPRIVPIGPGSIRPIEQPGPNGPVRKKYRYVVPKPPAQPYWELVPDEEAPRLR